MITASPSVLIYIVRVEPSRSRDSELGTAGSDLEHHSGHSFLLPPSKSIMQHFGKAALRVTKNYTKGYSDTQAKVRHATSNDPWGPSGTEMNEIAQLTYNQ